MRYGLSIFAAVLILGLSSCVHTTVAPSSSLQAVARSEATITAASMTAFTVVSQAAAANPPLIPTSDAAAIMRVLLQIEQANQQAIATTAAISTLSTANQSSLLQVLTPVAAAINTAVQNGTANVKDPTTKAAIQTALIALQSAVALIISSVQGAPTA